MLEFELAGANFNFTLNMVSVNLRIGLVHGLREFENWSVGSADAWGTPKKGLNWQAQAHGRKL